jgi:quercetin dioxygenase-like cupin family protein
MNEHENTVPLEWERLARHRDSRGESYTLPAAALEFLGAVREAHVATVIPGGTRGNHAHPHHRETLVVLSVDDWWLHWESPDGTRHREEIEGPGGVAIRINAGVPHAVSNGGFGPLVIVSLSDRTGQELGDTTRHVLV